MEFSKQIDVEGIARGTLVLLYEKLNDAIVDQAARWSDGDSAFYGLMGRDNPGITLESVLPENFYVGHVPSLINAPVEKYPNIAVLVPTAIPTPGSQDDWMEEYAVELWIEVMCKSMVSEDEVNSRLVRTMEAVHNVLSSDDARTLRDTVTRVGGTPSITIGDVFVRRESSSGTGDRWFWQGARITYRCSKMVVY